MYRRYDFGNPTENETSRLHPHPLNDKIYEASTPDKKLQKSVEENGVFNPIIVNRNKEILSGTRRWLAAKKAGFKKVPVITLLSEGATGLLGEQFLIESNHARVKTEGEMLREANELLRIETELANQRMLSGSKDPSPKPDKGRAAAIVGRTLGWGKNKVLQAAAIAQAAEKGSRAAKAELRKLDRGETSVDAAYKAAVEKKAEKKKIKSEQQQRVTELQKLFGKKAEVQSSKSGGFNLFFYGIDEEELRKIAKVV